MPKSRKNARKRLIRDIERYLELTETFREAGVYIEYMPESITKSNTKLLDRIGWYC